MSAVVIDGTVRDCKEIKELGLPVFCKGVTPAGPYKDLGGNINTVIHCGGVVVNPGDIIVADDDGVVVVPLADGEDVLKQARSRAKLEEKWMTGLRQGRTTLEVVNLEGRAEKMGVQIVDGDRG